MRGHLRTSPKIAVKLEGSLYHRPSGNNNGQGTAGGSQQQAASSASTANILHPACVLNGSFISQTFQILYRNEDVSLSDMAQFRLHVLVDSHKVRPLLLVLSSLSLSLSRSTHLVLPVFTIDFFFFLLPPVFSCDSLSRSWLWSTATTSDNAKTPFFSLILFAHSTFSPLSSFELCLLFCLFFSLLALAVITVFFFSFFFFGPFRLKRRSSDWIYIW